MTEGCRRSTSVTPRRGSRFNRRWAIVFLVVMGGSAALTIRYARDRMSALPELRTVKMQRRDLRITVRATGTVEPEEIVEVGATVSGKVVDFGIDVDYPNKPVDVGSRVSRDCVLLQIDRQIYEVELQKARASRRLAEADVDRLATQLKQATRDLERAQRLWNTNSQSDFDKIVTVHEAAGAELAIGHARLEQAIATARRAEIDLERTTVCSPIDGVVIDRRANLGQNVGASTSGLFLLAKSLDEMRIRTSVSETDIGKVLVGQPVTFTVDAHRERTMTGRVEKVLLNARVDGNFVTYDVLVTVDGPTTMLLPHMTADVEFETVKREQAWLVPTNSLVWWPSTEQIVPAFAAVTRSPAVDETQDGPKEGDDAVVWVPVGNDRVRPLSVRVGTDDGVLSEVVGEGFQVELPVVVGTVKKTTLARIIPSVKTLR